jgi:predicted O-linked N-acetylglucosamine transferase (SPINDLY family)
VGLLSTRCFARPFGAQALSYPLLPGALLALTQAHAERVHATAAVGAAIPADVGAAGRRLRLCYASLGWESHPHGQLMRGVFARHDRAAFEVVVFALSPDDGSQERADIAAAADRFVDLSRHPDPGAAMAWHPDAAESPRCDVALYLDGYIMRARPDLFGRRAPRPGGGYRLGPRVAPVQVATMYPASLGSAEVFQLHLADTVACPPELHDAQFAETLLPMPYSYYANDYRRSYARVLTASLDELLAAARAAEPADPLQAGPLAPLAGGGRRFRFLNFNQLHKLDGRTADCWTNILRRAGHALRVRGEPPPLLWQLANPVAATDAVRAEAASRGAGPGSLWFSHRLPIEQHLGRCRLAAEYGGGGLGLDTRQYNGHTTATDLLWGGAPYLTAPGEALAARVASSVAAAHGVPGMLAHSEKELEDLAVDLASLRPAGRRGGACQWCRGTTEQLGWLGGAVRANRLHAPLFDTASWVRDFEAGLQDAHRRHTASTDHM